MKIKYLLLLILIIIPINVKAASIDIKCSKSSADADSYVNCIIVAKDDYVSGGSGKISVINGTIVDMRRDECPIGTVSNDSFECVGSLTERELSLVSFRVHIGSIGKTIVGIDDATVVDKNWNNTKVSSATYDILVFDSSQYNENSINAEPIHNNPIIVPSTNNDISIGNTNNYDDTNDESSIPKNKQEIKKEEPKEEEKTEENKKTNNNYYLLIVLLVMTIIIIGLGIYKKRNDK